MNYDEFTHRMRDRAKVRAPQGIGGQLWGAIGQLTFGVIGKYVALAFLGKPDHRKPVGGYQAVSPWG